ncbi:MAG: sel1 repeat family protein, partial [Candidatus Heimdallarchaeota archaeon]|nr:sel1 repeat family protein [Candidatus Heimdallarchaeota archaeon]
KNIEKEIYWYQQAANLGLARAQFFLASAYEEGRGVKKDLVAAYRWYEKASKNGDADAYNNLVLLRTQMSQDEIKTAENQISHDNGLVSQ